MLVLVVTAASAAGQQPPSLRLLPHNAVSRDQFSVIVGVRELRDGRVIVADRREKRLALVDWTSSTQVIGRNGNGPGEYGGVAAIYRLAEDSTLFVELPAMRLHLLNGDSIVRTLAMHEIAPLSGLNFVGADTRGFVVGIRGVTSSGRSTAALGRADTLLLLEFNRSSGSVGLIARLKGRGGVGGQSQRGSGNRPGVIVTANPLIGEDQAVRFSDGWTAIARVSPYRVDWRTANGEWISGAVLPFQPISLTRREKCIAMGHTDANCDVELFTGWPDYAPPFIPALESPTLLAAPDGLLVINRTRSTAFRGNRYDLVDRTGKLVGILSLPPNERIVGFGSKCVFVAAKDEVDLLTLRRHPWPPSQ